MHAVLLTHGAQQGRSAAVECALPHLPALVGALDALPLAADVNVSAAGRRGIEQVPVALPRLCPPGAAAAMVDDGRAACGGAIAAAAGVASACLAELVRAEASASHALAALQVSTLEGGAVPRAMGWLEWLTSSRAAAAAAERALRRAEGKCFGLAYTRAADGFGSLVQRLISRLPRKHVHLAPLGRSGFWRAAAITLRSASAPPSPTREEHAPAEGRSCPSLCAPLVSSMGMLALVRAAHEGLAKHAESSAAKLHHSGLLAALADLLEPARPPLEPAAARAVIVPTAAETRSRMRHLHGGAPARGGGAASASLLLNAISLALYVPFGSRGERSAAALVALQHAMYTSELLGSLLHSLPLAEGHNPEVCVSLISRLVLGSTHFAKQYVALGGAAPHTLRMLLATARTPPVLTDALLILCQVNHKLPAAPARAHVLHAMRTACKCRCACTCAWCTPAWVRRARRCAASRGVSDPRVPRDLFFRRVCLIARADRAARRDEPRR